MSDRVAGGLERFAHPETVAIGTSGSVARGGGPGATSVHSLPGWKVVVACSGVLEVGVAGGPTLVAEAVVVPPSLSHRIVTTGAWVAALYEPGVLAAPAWPTPLALPRTAIPGAVVDGGDLDEVVEDLLSLLRCRVDGARPVDERVRVALDVAAEGGSPTDVAERLGVSPAHLRRLAHRELGTGLVRARTWARLRRAMGHGELSVGAAEAGFADQAHLSRSARALVGRTPGEILRARKAADA